MVCVERRQSTASDERTRRSLHGRAHLLSARVRGHRVRGHQSGQRSSGQRSLVRSEVISGSEVIGSEVSFRVRGHPPVPSRRRSGGRRRQAAAQQRVPASRLDSARKPGELACRTHYRYPPRKSKQRRRGIQDGRNGKEDEDAGKRAGFGGKSTNKNVEIIFIFAEFGTS